MWATWGQRLWRAGVFAALIVGLGGIGPGTARAGEFPARASRVAQVEDVASLDPVQGLVQHRAAGTADEAWSTVTEVILVREGDQVRTDSLGLAHLTFFEGTEVDILPNSVVTVDRLDIHQVAQDGAFEITLKVLAGDTLNRVKRVSDPLSRYEIDTPSAVITVRGTEFWTSVYPMGETQVRVLEGLVEVQGITPEGQVTTAVEVEPGFMATVSAGGEISPIEKITDTPQYPPHAPLAPDTCGNARCEPEETKAGSCPADCRSLPACGDGVCIRLQGENAITCPADCPLPGQSENPQSGAEPATLHFFWGEHRCDMTPGPAHMTSPIAMFWGIGCFDTEAQAGAHPHPASYQLIVDGQAWDMSSLRQSGPHIHRPYCPWGWTFNLGPVVLPPGQHTLTLVETVTDTWSAESGGRQAGEVVQLTCTLRVVR
jgi:hypothetical protein